MNRLQFKYGYPPSQPAIWAIVAMQIIAGQRNISRANYRTYSRHQRYLNHQAAQIWETAMIHGSALYYMGPDGMREVKYDDAKGGFGVVHG